MPCTEDANYNTKWCVCRGLRPFKVIQLERTNDRRRSLKKVPIDRATEARTSEGRGRAVRLIETWSWIAELRWPASDWWVAKWTVSLVNCVTHPFLNCHMCILLVLRHLSLIMPWSLYIWFYLAVICNLLYFVLCVCLFYFIYFLIQPSGCNYL